MAVALICVGDLAPDSIATVLPRTCVAPLVCVVSDAILRFAARFLLELRSSAYDPRLFNVPAALMRFRVRVVPESSATFGAWLFTCLVVLL